MNTEPYQQQGATVYRLYERRDNKGRLIKCNQYDFGVRVDVAGGGTQSDAEEEASRFKLAYNNTYHKGINPEAVEELLQVAKALWKQNILDYEAQENLNRIIQKATL